MKNPRLGRPRVSNKPGIRDECPPYLARDRRLLVTAMQIEKSQPGGAVHLRAIYRVAADHIQTYILGNQRHRQPKSIVPILAAS